MLVKIIFFSGKKREAEICRALTNQMLECLKIQHLNFFSFCEFGEFVRAQYNEQQSPNSVCFEI